ncbi:hypothetical protein HC725_04230 [Vibrio sp. S17_S38]|uniref:hypothetical protein n=1 Tax=Vibrio sp. S17_S38 TaxID=2720229 RepID=UPI0016800868|nr:hypothetical protein [Vibrio sp. S17_S38]MBD1572485.1 hypothetical protein [Vibrio sp. S17_S38]
MSPLEQQKSKQDGVFAKALRAASTAFVQMGGHPRILLHHSRRNELIDNAIKALQTVKREGDAYHQLGQSAPIVTDTELADDQDSPLEHVGFVKVDDTPMLASVLSEDSNDETFSLAINNPYGQVVKFTSSNEAIATVDEKTGAITPIGNGEVSIKVAFNKKGEYPRIEDSFDLVIDDANPSGEAENELQNDDTSNEQQA